MRSLILLSLSACVILPQTTGRVEPGTFFAVTELQGGDWSPDGDRLLVSSDASEVLALPVDGGPAEVLSREPRIAVSWFPDGARLLLATVGEDAALCVLEADGRVADLPGAPARFLGWADDRSTFFAAGPAAQPGSVALYRYGITAGYPREQVLGPLGGLEPVAVSGDGGAVVLSGGTDGRDLLVWRAEAPDEAPVPLAEREGRPRALAFEPGADAVWYADDGGGAWRVVPSAADRTRALDDPRPISFVAFSGGGRYRAHGIEDGGQTRLGIVDLETASLLPLPPGLPEGRIEGLRFSPDETKVSFFVASDTSASDMYSWTLSSSDPVRLARSLPEALDDSVLATSTPVRVPGVPELRALLYQPASAAPEASMPALVYLEGTSASPPQPRYRPEVQALVHYGYVVLVAAGGADAATAARDHLAGLERVDPARIGLLGADHGGAVVLDALTREPGAFRAGVDLFGADRTDRAAVVRAERAERVRSPLLVITSDDDPGTAALVAAVRANGVPAERAALPGGGREQRVEAMERILSFLEQHLAARE